MDFLRSFCLSLPAVTEDVKWGNNLVFSVWQKMFCITGLEPPFHYSFKVADEAFETLGEHEAFSQAPYLARAKWVLVTDVAALSQQNWQGRLWQRYKLVRARLSRKEKQTLGL